jgi:hypothetical protein
MPILSTQSAEFAGTAWSATRSKFGMNHHFSSQWKSKYEAIASLAPGGETVEPLIFKLLCISPILKQESDMLYSLDFD